MARDWQAATTELSVAVQRKVFGLASDVDGTLSPIVDDPRAARVTPRNLDLLGRLAERLPVVAVLSGRSAQDVAKRVGLPGLVYIGNHGMDAWQQGQVSLLPAVAGYRQALTAALHEIDGLLAEGMSLEDKGATLSVHYRQTSRPDQAARELAPALEAITKTHGLRLTRGRMVFEVRPPVDVDKGTAFADLVRSNQLEAACYLGDDTTDVAVFRAAVRLRGSGECLAYGLGVRSQGTPQEVLAEADFLVDEVTGVESFLDWLLKARMASST